MIDDILIDADKLKQLILEELNGRYDNCEILVGFVHGMQIKISMQKDEEEFDDDEVAPQNECVREATPPQEVANEQ